MQAREERLGQLYERQGQLHRDLVWYTRSLSTAANNDEYQFAVDLLRLRMEELNVILKELVRLNLEP